MFSLGIRSSLRAGMCSGMVMLAWLIHEVGYMVLCLDCMSVNLFYLFVLLAWLWCFVLKLVRVLGSQVALRRERRLLGRKTFF